MPQSNLEEIMTSVKVTPKETIMQNKDNHLMMGYASLQDMLNSVFGLKNSVLNFLASFLGALTVFISTYIYDDAKAVYTLVALIGFDAFTGILRAIKNKTFSSARLPRILVIVVMYLTMLAIGWNLSKVSVFYSWVPSALYCGFVTTLLISVIENLNQLGIISDSFYSVLKSKIDLLQSFVLGKNYNKKKKK